MPIPRLHSLRSFRLGLLISQPLRGCKLLLRMEDGDKPHPYIGGTSLELPHTAHARFILSQRRKGRKGVVATSAMRADLIRLQGAAR